MAKNKDALIRVCARCEKVFIGKGGCPVCEFGTYGAIWAIGYINTILRLITGKHRQK